MFGGVGFALSTENLGAPPALIVGVLGLAGAIGITQLWNLDIRVYHQLLDSCFVQGLRLEQEYPWLPQLRSSMLSTQTATYAEPEAQVTPSLSPKGVLARVVWFYVVGNTSALLISLAGMLVFLTQTDLLSSLIMLFTAIGLGFILIGLWTYEMFRHTRSPLLEQWSNQALQPTPLKRRG